MKCPKCGSDNPDDAEFCQNCGKKLILARFENSLTEILFYTNYFKIIRKLRDGFTLVNEKKYDYSLVSNIKTFKTNYNQIKKTTLKKQTINHIKTSKKTY